MKNIESIYEKIPEVKGCKRGCTDCCGPVPFSQQEWNRLPRKNKRMRPAKSKVSCRFKEEKGCMIYKIRPAICRLFGAVDHDMLKCPYGAKSEQPLSKEEAKGILVSSGKGVFVS